MTRSTTRVFDLHLPAFAAILLLAVAPVAHAAPITYVATLDGYSEVPINGSAGIGTAQVDVDIVAHTMRVQASFSGLSGTTTASHIHAATTLSMSGTAGVATQTPTFTLFPLGVTSGSYDHTFDMTLTASFNGSYVTANGGTAASAEAALYQAMANGKAYLNIHTSVFAGGEIRGFLQPGAPTPAAATSWGRIKSMYR